jgi:membrane peptidoglycan carboxypeptidase
VLAATISQPSYYDPDVNKAAAESRWHYVIDGMVKQHWLSASDAAGLKFPSAIPPSQTAAASGCPGPLGFICQDVKFDLAKHGFSEDRLAAGGYKIYTTIDQTAQLAAQKAEAQNNGGFRTSGPDKERESALVSVQPGDGAIRALYGGSEYCPLSHKHRDSCTDLSGLAGTYARPPGSSFKPYTLIAALQEGISLDSTFPGPAHIDFPGTNGKGISNSEGESCGRCTLTDALAKSINTIFVPLAQQVGPDKVAQVAFDAGIPKKRIPTQAMVPSLTLGTSDVSPLDQAVAYATIAAQGIEAEPYIVAKVVNSDGRTVYKAEKKTHRAFDADVMADTTFAMQQVLKSGTAAGKGLPGRPAAGKTGTNGQGRDNFDAWFIGFTPQLSTAVWYGNAVRNHPVTTGGNPLYGGDLPALTWQQMMTAALQGKPVLNFPPPAHVGHVLNPTPTATASPTASSSSPTPSLTPTLAPTPTVQPTHTLPVVTSSPSPTASSTSTSGTGGGGSPPAANDGGSPPPGGG